MEAGARENVGVVNVIYANRGCKILDKELKRVGASPDGVRAASRFGPQDPSLDWVALARGMGVEAVRVESSRDFSRLSPPR